MGKEESGDKVSWWTAPVPPPPVPPSSGWGRIRNQGRGQVGPPAIPNRPNTPRRSSPGRFPSAFFGSPPVGGRFLSHCSSVYSFPSQALITANPRVYHSKGVMQCIIWLHAEETFISFNKLWTLCDLFLFDNVDRLLWRVMCQFEVPIKLFDRRQAAIYKEKRGSESWTISPPGEIMLCITRPLLNVFRLEVDGGRVEEWGEEVLEWMFWKCRQPACLVKLLPLVTDTTSNFPTSERDKGYIWKEMNVEKTGNEKQIRVLCYPYENYTSNFVFPILRWAILSHSY